MMGFEPSGFLDRCQSPNPMCRTEPAYCRPAAGLFSERFFLLHETCQGGTLAAKRAKTLENSLECKKLHKDHQSSALKSGSITALAYILQRTTISYG